ncbi:hypothetical protein NIES2100_26200 [Calothrix sp. NIES-2100]|nr:hypothetical protein NIES2100_26200 [Calothrix sp. NIES-2100]
MVVRPQAFKASYQLEQILTNSKGVGILDLTAHVIVQVLVLLL